MSSVHHDTPRRRLGVRARLTLFATAVTLGVCVLVCGTLYGGLEWALHREVDSFLEGEVQEFKAIIAEEHDNLGEIEREIRDELGSRQRADLTFRMVDPAGKLLITSDPKDAFPAPWPLSPKRHKRNGEPSFDTLHEPSETGPFRVCSERIELPDRGEVVLQAVYRLSRVERSLAITRWVCLSAILLALILSIIGGRAVARRSLQPVSALTETARHISARRLSTRLPLSGAGDELDDLARTLNDMLGRVESSFRQIQQFTADAAHELRTPLTALRGGAEHALAQPRSEAQLRAVLEQSLDYYRILSRVTDDLLLLARLDAGQEPLQSESFSLREALLDMVELYRPLAAEREIQIDLHADEDGLFAGDPGKIRRVFSNLLDNAIKYMGGPGDIEVTLSKSGDGLSVTVADSGPGIPPEDLPHIFERFYRVDRVRAANSRPEARSAGLGLAICQSIVHAHGGDIAINNIAPNGARVIVNLPLHDRNTTIKSRPESREKLSGM